MTKEEKAVYGKAYREKNKEKIKLYQQSYDKKNKEIKAIRDKKRRENNPEKFAETRKKNRYNNYDSYRKSEIISDWKYMGLVCSDYDLLYSNYLAETYCDICRVKFGKKGDGTNTFKCMDHSHETGLFRNFLCNPCNIKRGE